MAESLNSCDQCSRRKIRCSRIIPTCEQCLKVNRQCTYSLNRPVGRPRHHRSISASKKSTKASTAAPQRSELIPILPLGMPPGSGLYKENGQSREQNCYSPEAPTESNDMNNNVTDLDLLPPIFDDVQHLEQNPDHKSSDTYTSMLSPYEALDFFSSVSNTVSQNVTPPSSIFKVSTDSQVPGLGCEIGPQTHNFTRYRSPSPESPPASCECLDRVTSCVCEQLRLGSRYRTKDSASWNACVAKCLSAVRESNRVLCIMLTCDQPHRDADMAVAMSLFLYIKDLLLNEFKFDGDEQDLTCERPALADELRRMRIAFLKVVNMWDLSLPLAHLFRGEGEIEVCLRRQLQLLREQIQAVIPSG
ncbi:uncharacterized protein PgNI_06759 [Pyricularia grisea]|uniref:Zn(2)-C6 fungal-type domain-containing protein n=1 Tax=Pyricularia grisea TaxID=148305 RepID=A0A6P8B2X4_PYRGI|nr:uncharacterized protein PgNI_06759 [Pyricularia grisea]TLD09216.1 hypothetical protein PgNI_06759 [Pyricularia grisea]